MTFRPRRAKCTNIFLTGKFRDAAKGAAKKFFFRGRMTGGKIRKKKREARRGGSGWCVFGKAVAAFESLSRGTKAWLRPTTLPASHRPGDGWSLRSPFDKLRALSGAEGLRGYALL